MSSEDHIERILLRVEGVTEKLSDVVSDMKLIAERQSNQSAEIQRLADVVEKEREKRIELRTDLDKWVNRGWGAWGVAILLFTVVTAFGWQKSVDPALVQSPSKRAAQTTTPPTTGS